MPAHDKRVSNGVQKLTSRFVPLSEMLRRSQAQTPAYPWRCVICVAGCLLCALFLSCSSTMGSGTCPSLWMPWSSSNERSTRTPKVEQPIFVGKNFWLPTFEFREDDFENMRQVYERQADRRREVLFNMRDDSSAVMDLYNVLVPEVICPNLVRIGNVLDGGKWVCNPFAIRYAPPSSTTSGACAIYSLGLRGEISFDRDIQLVTRQACRLHAYDKDDQSDDVKVALASINGDNKPARIATFTNTTTHTYSLLDLMKENGDERIEILKMDIEGFEFGVIPQLLRRVKVCQILIEIHKTPKAASHLLRVFSEFGFYLYSYEVLGTFQYLSEYSLIHKDCFERYGTVMLAKYLS